MADSDLAFAGAARQAQLIADGAVSARELTQLHLDRIAALDPQLNAWRVVLGEQALAEADAADARRAAGEGGILNGVPVAIKDDADLAGEPTAWGTSAHGGPVAQDSDVVAALRRAGAVVLGKTHVPEMTICAFTESLTFGATRNPWDPDRTPGGSSGGTGAAVAAGMCGVGLGSDGAGSIRIPAAWNGLFGLKPQAGRISLGPRTDAWNGLSVLGPIARTVADAALFLDATAAPASATFGAAAAQAAPAGGYLAASRRAVGTLTVAISVGLPPGAVGRVSSEARQAVEQTGDLLRELGHRVVRRELRYGTAGPNLAARYLAGIREDVAGMPHPERLEKRTRGFARLGAPFPRALVAKLTRERDALAAGVVESFGDADVVLTPGPTGGPFKVGAFQGRSAAATLAGMSARAPFYGPFNATGQPAASVPAGWDTDGLPLAIQLVGRPGAEATLLSLAAQLEAARPWADRRPVVS